jgi:hypothetical protein
MASIFFGSRNAIQIKNEVFRGTIGFPKKPTQMSFEKIENGENEEWDLLEKKEMDELFLHEKTSFTFPNFSIIYLLI